MDENKLWVSISKHDSRQAFDRLYAHVWESLYQMAWSRTMDQDLAKDLVQEVFVALWEKRKHIEPKESIKQYLLGMLKYSVIDYFQSEKMKMTALERAYLVMDTVTEEEQFDLSYEEVEGILEDELGKMPHNMRESFKLKMDNRNIREIAAQLNLADQTVSNLLVEANKRLKKNLPQRFENHQGGMVLSLLYLVNDLLTKT